MSGRDATLEAIAGEIQALSPPDRLRFAADLLEAQRPELAREIAKMVVEELGAAMALRAVPPKPRKP